MVDFVEYVEQWAAIKAARAELEARLAPLRAKELEMRKAIVDSLIVSVNPPDQKREGTLRYALPDGRKLKFTSPVDRTIDPAEIESAREDYRKLNDAPPFDDLLRVKYELDKRQYTALPEAARLAASRMIVAKRGTPTLEIED